MPLNQWSPNALQSLTVLCMAEKCYTLESWVTKRNFEYGLLVKTAARLCGRVKTSCYIWRVCQCYFCILNLWFLNSFYAWRSTEKIEVRKGSYEKSMKFKLKTTSFSRAVSSSHMALAKAEGSCCLILKVERVHLMY